MRDKKRLTFLKQNSGVSLVELIVVISIMAVLTGLVVLSVGIIPQNRVRACARELVERFENTRTDSLAYQDAKVKVYITSDGIYADTVVNRSGTDETKTEKIGNASLELYCLTSADGAVETKLSSDSGDYLIFSFNRSSGGFKFLEGKIGGADIADDLYCKKLKVSCGGYNREIEMVPVTGKVTLK